jgi:heptosyltransferase-2
MKLSHAHERLGFPRLQSGLCLTQSLTPPGPLAHRSEYWRVAGAALNLKIPTRADLMPPPRPPQATALLHSGARLPARVWPLENFRHLAARLRAKKIPVQVVCDPGQLGWWQSHGENAACPRTLTELLALIDQAGIFIGNCSGAGHLAAICGVPTFTLYGPSMHEWFMPMHPAAEIFEGRACKYKPCSDYCHYAQPFCLTDVTADEVWPRVEQFLKKHL